MMTYRHIIIVITTIITLKLQITAKINAVTVFRREEIELHKYSAVLAAIEPYRLELEEEIKNSINPIVYALHKMKGTNFETLKSSNNGRHSGVDIAYLRFEGRVKQIARAYDMNVPSFNEMSTRISKDGGLKSKVLLQAYYYRLSTDLYSNIKTVPRISVIPTSPILENNGEIGNEGKSIISNPLKTESEFHRFCRTLSMIEIERIKQIEKLKTDLGIARLPDNMCRPDVFPTMCKQVQFVCENFPNSVSKIKQNNGFGFENENFDNLYEKANTDFIYQFRVKREIKKIESMER